LQYKIKIYLFKSYVKISPKTKWLHQPESRARH